MMSVIFIFIFASICVVLDGKERINLKLSHASIVNPLYGISVVRLYIKVGFWILVVL